MFLNKKTLLVALFLLAGCNPTPEQAKKKLAEMKVPQTQESLLASTKSQKSGETAKLLVAAGVDVNARQANGMTALMSAAFNRQLDTAKELLKKGADVNANASGYNAISLAAEHGDLDMAQLLIEHGADPLARPPGGLSAIEKAQQRTDIAMTVLLQNSKSK